MWIRRKNLQKLIRTEISKQTFVPAEKKQKVKYISLTIVDVHKDYPRPAISRSDEPLGKIWYTVLENKHGRRAIRKGRLGKIGDVITEERTR